MTSAGYSSTKIASCVLDVDLNDVERSLCDIFRACGKMHPLELSYSSLDEYHRTRQEQVVFSNAMDGYRESLTQGYMFDDHEKKDMHGVETFRRNVNFNKKMYASGDVLIDSSTTGNDAVYFRFDSRTSVPRFYLGDVVGPFNRGQELCYECGATRVCIP